MLKTVWLTEQRNNLSGTALLLGGFDGLHRGHRLLVERAKNSGLPVGIMTILDGKDGKNLFTFSEREAIFQRAGVDFVFELPFSEIKSLSAVEFIALLRREFQPNLFVCGEDFRFGNKAAGTPQLLKELGQVCVEILPLLGENGKKISAGEIKTLLSAGDLVLANACLGERYFLTGKVEKDRQVGRTIGFPTANIRYPKEKHPIKIGVYETEVEIDGRRYRGITNYGARPTFDDDEVWTETYVDGFSGDLYGQTLTVEFVRFLREIQRFPDADGLKRQLQSDLRRIREHD